MEFYQDAEGIERTESQPVPAEIPATARRRVRTVGELRLPLAGPYAPRVQLVQLPDGRLLWRLRLWEFDRPVVHVVGTDTLRRFARINRIPAVERRIDQLLRRATGSAGA